LNYLFSFFPLESGLKVQEISENYAKRISELESQLREANLRETTLKVEFFSFRFFFFFLSKLNFTFHHYIE